MLHAMHQSQTMPPSPQPFTNPSQLGQRLFPQGAQMPYNVPPMSATPLSREQIMGAQGQTPGGIPQAGATQTAGANSVLAQQMQSMGNQANAQNAYQFQNQMLPANAAFGQQRRGLMDRNWLGTMNNNLGFDALNTRFDLNNLNLWMGLA